MPKRILMFLVLCLGYQTIASQNLVDCTYLLADAKEAYEAGMVELVPELLLECIKSNGLSGESRKQAYKLVLNSYLFDYLTVEADSLMDDFISEYPLYRAENSDTQEFVFLLNAHLRDRGIDPDQQPAPAEVPADLPPEGKERKFFVRGAGVEGNSFGFKLGGTLSIPLTVEGYSAGNPAEDDGHFGPLPGTLAGGEINLVLNRKLEASMGLLYSMTRLSYSSTPLSFTSYRYVEAQHHLVLPLTIIFKLNPDNTNISYYLRGGMVPGYLFYASGKGTRSIEGTQEDVVVEKINITESRGSFNLGILLGGGVRIPLNRAFVYVEGSLNYNVLLANRNESRYLNNDITWLLYHVDSDFRVHQFSICAGICWDLTRQ